MTQFAEIEHEIGNILAVADELGEDEHEAALEYLDALSVQEQDKVDAICFAVRKRQSEIDFLKNEEDRLRARRKAIESRLIQFKEYLLGIFLREGLQKVKGLKGTLYLRKSTSVEVIALDKLPGQFVETRVDFVPRKTLIREQLKKGERVPGAKMQERQILVVN